MPFHPHLSLHFYLKFKIGNLPHRRQWCQVCGAQNRQDRVSFRLVSNNFDIFEFKSRRFYVIEYFDIAGHGNNDLFVINAGKVYFDLIFVGFGRVGVKVNPDFFLPLSSQKTDLVSLVVERIGAALLRKRQIGGTRKVTSSYNL